MAKLFPRIDPDSIENQGERMLARVLVRCLPANIEVYHGFNWLKTNSQGRLIQGESDFVILDPDFGLLVVEVKGGRLSFDPETALWEQNGLQLAKSPAEQARNAMHLFRQRLEHSQPASQDSNVASFGYAVCFPQCQWQGALPLDLTRDVVWDARAIDETRFLEAYRTCASRWRKSSDALDGRVLEGIRDILRPEFNLVESLVGRIEDGNRVLLRLTDNQRGLLDMASENNRFSVRGDAGSGKTMVALELARRLAADGKRTLFVCYNRMLADWITRTLSSEPASNLTVRTFHELAHDVCKAGGQPIGFSPSERHWLEDIPLRMEECLPAYPAFQAIVVDEGQDFRLLWWDVLEQLLDRTGNEEPRFYVFHDPSQALHRDEAPTLPGNMPTKLQLPRNVRNTRRIVAKCSDVIGRTILCSDQSPEGNEPQEVEGASTPQIEARIRQSLNRYLAGADRLNPSQVVVLTDAETMKALPRKLGDHPTTDDDGKWSRSEAVLVTTVARFKGMESDVVIAALGRHADVPTRYVAYSRAKHELVIIAPPAG